MVKLVRLMLLYKDNQILKLNTICEKINEQEKIILYRMNK